MNVTTRRKLIKAAKTHHSAAASRLLQVPGALEAVAKMAEAKPGAPVPPDNHIFAILTELQRANAFLQAVLLLD